MVYLNGCAFLPSLRNRPPSLLTLRVLSRPPVFHADPHQGNVLIRPRPFNSRSPHNFEIVLLDHGARRQLLERRPHVGPPADLHPTFLSQANTSAWTPSSEVRRLAPPAFAFSDGHADPPPTPWLPVAYAKFWLSLIAPNSADVQAQRKSFAKAMGCDESLYPILESASPVLSTSRCALADSRRPSPRADIRRPHRPRRSRRRRQLRHQRARRRRPAAADEAEGRVGARHGRGDRV